MSDNKRILVLRYRFIGDTLMTIPFLRQLRQQEPDAHIELWVGQDGYPLVEHCPYVNTVTAFEPRQIGFWPSINQLKERQFDRVYVLKRSFSSALLVRLAGIPERIGFDTECRRFLLTRSIPYRPTTQHEAQCFLDLLDPGETDKNQLDLDIWLTPEDKSKVKAQLQLLDTEKPRILFHPTSTNPAKCWPQEHFQELAQLLVETYDAQICFLGTQQDHETVEKIIKGVSEPQRDNLYNWCGETSLRESLALITQLDLVVANDSGMIHMAAACNTPVVALFGPMDPQQWRPLGKDVAVLSHPDLTCRPCRMKIRCDNRYPCLTELMPQKVLSACNLFLKSWNGPKSLSI